MNAMLLSLALALPGLKAPAKCPRPQLENVNLSHKIDRVVFKNTYARCRLKYKGSPCLVRLTQIANGAFHAVCGERVSRTVVDAVDANIDLDSNEAIMSFQPNCSRSIFEAYLPETWMLYSNQPITITQNVAFCETSQTRM